MGILIELDKLKMTIKVPVENRLDFPPLNPIMLKKFMMIRCVICCIMHMKFEIQHYS